MKEDEFRKKDVTAPDLTPIHASYEIAGTCRDLLKMVEGLPVRSKEDKETRQILHTGIRLVAGLLFNIAVIAETKHKEANPFLPVRPPSSEPDTPF